MSAASQLTLDEAAQLARRGALEARIGPWVLVGRPLAEDDKWRFQTASISSSVILLPSGPSLTLHDDELLYPLVKKDPGGPFQSTILVGRSSSNDVVLVHESVSKLHARLQLSGTGSATVSDAGSSNGTIVDERGLAPGESARVRSGAALGFGKYQLRLLSQADARAALTELNRARFR